MPPKIRKYVSGHDKRNKKKKVDELIECQRGALDKFIVKEPQVSTVNPNNEGANVENDSIGGLDVEIDIVNVPDDNLDDMPIDCDDDLPNDNVNVSGDVPVDCNDDVPIDYNDDVPIDDVPDVHENDNTNVDDSDDNFDDVPIYLPDIYDPRVWDGLDSKMIDLLVKNGPKRDLNIVKGPKDKFSRRFTANLYTRVLSNGEKCDKFKYCNVYIGKLCIT